MSAWDAMIIRDLSERYSDRSGSVTDFRRVNTDIESIEYHAKQLVRALTQHTYEDGPLAAVTVALAACRSDLDDIEKGLGL